MARKKKEALTNLMKCEMCREMKLVGPGIAPYYIGKDGIKEKFVWLCGQCSEPWHLNFRASRSKQGAML